jgi:L-alanine-DL-glutamate epimerase-like enolase superfamily enzyme
MRTTGAPDVRIAGIETRTYRFPLDPPFTAAWDPAPRTAQEATLVLVRSDDGLVGVASGGDGLSDRAVLERRLRGLDPRRTEIVREICETVDFHGGRPWAVEVAVWDLVARALGEPLWRLLGGRQERLIAYASSGELVEPAERVRRIRALAGAGVRAVKVRFGNTDWRDDLAVVEHIRGEIGDSVELMVDANQGWRMPGDRAPRWDVATAAQCARELERLGVYWLEEPLPTDDVEAYGALRRLTSLRVAAGEMVRSLAQARDLALRGGVDVLQPDVVLAGGISGCRRLAGLAELCGRAWSPHTWSNGLGLVANLHAACAFSTCPYVEVPLDPPAWPPERRDWLLPAVVEIREDGTVAPPPGPGLGVEPDFDALETFRIG